MVFSGKQSFPLKTHVCAKRKRAGYGKPNVQAMESQKAFAHRANVQAMAGR